MIFKIQNSEIIETKTGKVYKRALLENGTEISVWPDYSQYEKVEAGAEVEGQIFTKGKYQNLVDANKTIPTYQKQTKVQQITQLQQNKAELIKQSQEKRDESIAYFNAINSAISLLEARESLKTMSEMEIQAAIRLWRDWFIKEFKDKPPF